MIRIRTLHLIITIVTVLIGSAFTFQGCKPKFPFSCSGDADCPDKSYCYSNVCVNDKCENDSDCLGRKCMDSRCVNAAFACVPETDDELCGDICGYKKTDRCGKSRTCECPLPYVCGGGNVFNKCACADEIHPKALFTNWIPIPLSPPSKAYQELTNGVVLDTQTCLRWKEDYQKEGDIHGFNWEKANLICSNLGNGWRLPTMTELLSLVDYQKDEPTINQVFNMPNSSSWFWSSTSGVLGGSDFARGVYFEDGNSDWNPKTNIGHVRCVR